MRVEFECERGGVPACPAAWDVRRAKVFGRCDSTTGIEPFDRLVQQVMEQEPYRQAHRVFWTVDNGSSHRGAASLAFQHCHEEIAQPFQWNSSAQTSVNACKKQLDRRRLLLLA